MGCTSQKVPEEGEAESERKTNHPKQKCLGKLHWGVTVTDRSDSSNHAAC